VLDVHVSYADLFWTSCYFILYNKGSIALHSKIQNYFVQNSTAGSVDWRCNFNAVRYTSSESREYHYRRESTWYSPAPLHVANPGRPPFSYVDCCTGGRISGLYAVCPILRRSHPLCFSYIYVPNNARQYCKLNFEFCFSDQHPAAGALTVCSLHVLVVLYFALSLQL